MIFKIIGEDDTFIFIYSFSEALIVFPAVP